MRVTKKPEERRNEILDTAEMLFNMKGYSKTTIKDILDRIGIAKGTFYYYFQSKEEVMDAIILRIIDSGVDSAKAVAADPSLTAPQKLFYIIAGEKSEPEREEQMMEELHQVNNAEMHLKSLVETIHQLSPVITDIVEQGIAEGAFHTPHPRETVELLLVSFQLLFDEGIFPWQPEDLVYKAKAFAFNMEVLLGAEKGSFYYIAETYEDLLKNRDGNTTEKK